MKILLFCIFLSSLLWAQTNQPLPVAPGHSSEEQDWEREWLREQEEQEQMQEQQREEEPSQFSHDEFTREDIPGQIKAPPFFRRNSK